MSTDIIPFEFGGQQVRVEQSNGNVHFVLTDVCKVLGIANSRDAASRLDDDEKGVWTTDTLGGPQKVATVTESGLYALVMTSRRPNARTFRKWVTGEVLPALRRRGTYTMPGARASDIMPREADDLGMQAFLAFLRGMTQAEGQVEAFGELVADVNRKLHILGVAESHYKAVMQDGMALLSEAIAKNGPTVKRVGELEAQIAVMKIETAAMQEAQQETQTLTRQIIAMAKANTDLGKRLARCAIELADERLTSSDLRTKLQMRGGGTLSEMH